MVLLKQVFVVLPVQVVSVQIQFIRVLKIKKVFLKLLWMTLLLVVLGTGRTHQIRVHLADSGHVIVGDPRYGHGGGLLLHAAYLSWPGHAFFVPPPWRDGFGIERGCAQDIMNILATAPAKEGAI